jgi:hypothetical protein
MAKKAEPEPQEAKLSVRIDRALLRRLKKECADRDVKMQVAVQEAVLQWLKKS